MSTRVMRHAHRSAPARRLPVLALPILAACVAQSLDGITRLLLPDANELNPLSAALGGPWSLALKVLLIAYLAFLGITASDGARPVQRRVLWIACAAGLFGAWSNVVAIL